MIISFCYPVIFVFFGNSENEVNERQRLETLVEACVIMHKNAKYAKYAKYA